MMAGGQAMDRKEARAQLKRYADEEMRDAPADRFQNLERLICEAEQNVGFDYDAPLRAKGGPMRKAMRKCMAWFLVPLFEEQRNKNARHAQILREIATLLEKEKDGGPGCGE